MNHQQDGRYILYSFKLLFNFPSSLIIVYLFCLFQIQSMLVIDFFSLFHQGNAIEGTNTRKIGRGKTTGISVAKKKKKSTTGKLHVTILPDRKVAVGPGASDFITEISLNVQKKAPLNVIK